MYLNPTYTYIYICIPKPHRYTWGVSLPRDSRTLPSATSRPQTSTSTQPAPYTYISQPNLHCMHIMY